MVTFSLFVDPLLGFLGGDGGRTPRFVQARLGQEVTGRTGLTRFLPARLHGPGFDVVVEHLTWKGSGDLAATSRSNCFLVVPEDRAGLNSGETVTVLLA